MSASPPIPPKATPRKAARVIAPARARTAVDVPPALAARIAGPSAPPKKKRTK